jgi:hypothetical protein
LFIKLAQITINEITDKMRNCLVANRDEDSADLNCWNLIASTNIRDYITRKKQRFNSLFVKHLNALGIITYFDLLNESKFPRSDRIKIFADNVLTGFPKEWKEKVESLEMVDNNRQEPNWMCFKIEKCIETSKVTVSHIRKCLLPLLKDSTKIQDKHKREMDKRMTLSAASNAQQSAASNTPHEALLPPLSTKQQAVFPPLPRKHQALLPPLPPKDQAQIHPLPTKQQVESRARGRSYPALQDMEAIWVDINVVLG